MFWAKARLSFDEYGPFQDLLQNLMMANTVNYDEFLMVSVKTEESRLSDYYIGVPIDELLGRFHKFKRINETDLPSEIDAFHLGDQTKESFKNRFVFRRQPGRR